MRKKHVILVTGATGFLGSHIVNKFSTMSHYTIIATKRATSSMHRINDTAQTNIRFYETDTADIENIFKENAIDVVIHTATVYGRDDGSITQILESNLMFPIKIAELAIKYNVKCFINTDSYFNKDNFSYLYLANYSLSKKSLLMWLKYMSKRIKVINMCLEHIYGDKDRDDKFVQFLIKKIAIEKISSIDLTHGHQKRDFIFIDDVVSAYTTVVDYSLHSEFSYKSFEVGTGTSVQIREFAEEIKRQSKSPTELNFGAIPYREDEIMNSHADIKELEMLGWKPQYSFINGISRILSAETATGKLS